MTNLTGKDLLEGLCDPDTGNSLMFFHGLESGPYGTKYTALSSRYDVTSPDFQGMDLDARLALADDLTEGMEDLVVVGSSMGGLVTALLYALRPERFAGYVLLAPALHWEGVSKVTRVPESAIVVQGTRDEVVPPETVRAFCRSNDVTLVEVDDDHRLHASLEAILDAVGKVV